VGVVPVDSPCWPPGKIFVNACLAARSGDIDDQQCMKRSGLKSKIGRTTYSFYVSPQDNHFFIKQISNTRTVWSQEALASGFLDLQAHTCHVIQYSYCTYLRKEVNCARASRSRKLTLCFFGHLIDTSIPAELQANDSRDPPADVQGFLATGVPSDILQLPALKFRVRFLTCSVPYLSPSV
jgi:hypothetical protein